MSDVPLAEAIRIDDFCHKNGIAFIRADIRGVFGSVFCDFGPSFTVLDVDGTSCGCSSSHEGTHDTHAS